MNAVLSIGDRVLLDDGRSATVEAVEIERYAVYGRSQHDVWVFVALDGGGVISVPIHRVEGRLDERRN